MIKIGQIGIGHNHGEGKMQAIRKFPELFDAIGYSETDEEWIKKRGNDDCYKDLKRYKEDELIEKCDLLIIETNVWELTKTAQKCIDKMVGYKDKWFEIIDSSFLPEDLKTSYKKLILSRLSLL